MADCVIIIYIHFQWTSFLTETFKLKEYVTFLIHLNKIHIHPFKLNDSTPSLFNQHLSPLQVVNDMFRLRSKVKVDDSDMTCNWNSEIWEIVILTLNHEEREREWKGSGRREEIKKKSWNRRKKQHLSSLHRSSWLPCFIQRFFSLL